MSAANLIARLSMDDSEFQGKVRRATKSSVDFGKQTERSAGAASGAIKRLAAAFGGFVLARAAVRGLTGALQEAASFEALELDFTVFLKDAEKARELIQRITKFSDATPFEANDLLQTTKNLLGAGIAGEKVYEVMQDIAAVASNGQQVGELGDALSKGFAKGKFQTEELNKFLERGINLLPELSKVTGKAGDELSKAIQKGIRFEDVTAAIAAMSQEGGLFYGRLEKQSKTATGLTSTLAGVWKSFKRDIGGPINDSLKPILESAIKAIASAGPAAASIGRALGGSLTIAAKLFDVLFTGATRFAALFELGLTKAMEDVVHSLPNFMKALIGVPEGLEARGWGEIADEIAGRGMGGIANRFKDELKGIVDGVKGATGAAGAAGETAAAKLIAAGKSLRGDLDEVSLIASDAGRSRRGSVDSYFPALTGFFDGRASASPKLAGLEGGGRGIEIDQGEVVMEISEVVKQQRITNSMLGDLKFDVE